MSTPPTASASLVNLDQSVADKIEIDDSDDTDTESGVTGSDPSSSAVTLRSPVSPNFFDADADFRILTGYGGQSEVSLADYMVEGISNVAFSLSSCDESRTDYYSAVVVEEGSLKLESNTAGRVHGPNTATETVCTVTAAGDGGNQNQAFRLYTVSDRTPQALPARAMAVAAARQEEIDLRITLPSGSPGYLRLGWRASGGQPRFAVLQAVNDSTAVTIPGLQPDTTYEIRAYLMTAQAFDLYRSPNSGPAGTLIEEGNPESKWISNLANAGLGKSISLSQATLPAPSPDRLPTQPPVVALPPSPGPTPDVDDDEDDEGDLDTPMPTDNDGTDSDGIDTPTPTDNDGTDSDGIDTLTPATPSPATPSPATPSPATPSPATPSPATPTPDTPTPDTQTPATPSPPTPTPPTPTPDTPTPATPTPDTPESGSDVSSGSS